MIDQKNVAASYEAAGAALERSREVLANLTRDKASAIARQVELTRTRERLALAGMAGGAASDRRALSDVTNEAARLQLTIENLGFALTAAHEEVEACTRAVERAAGRCNSSAALGLVGDLRAAGTRCSQAMTAFLEAYDEITEISNSVRRLGGRWPNRELFSSSVRRSLEHHMTGRRLTTGAPATSPSGRRELDATLELWIGQLEISLERDLQDGPAELDDEEAAQ